MLKELSQKLNFPYTSLNERIGIIALKSGFYATQENMRSAVDIFWHFIWLFNVLCKKI